MTCVTRRRAKEGREKTTAWRRLMMTRGEEGIEWRVLKKKKKKKKRNMGGMKVGGWRKRSLEVERKMLGICASRT
jgi:hypothetical protein